VINFESNSGKMINLQVYVPPEGTVMGRGNSQGLVCMLINLDC
jgi:hypothetical protein